LVPMGRVDPVIALWNLAIDDGIMTKT